MSDSTKGILLASVAALMWAVLAIALKMALNHIDSYTIVWWRFTVSFSLILIIILFKKPSSLKIIKKPPIMLVFAGMLLGFNFIGYQEGVHYSGPAVSQIIIQLGAITFALVGFLFFKEPANKLKISGFLLALVGFGIFFYQQINETIDVPVNMKLGIIWLIIGGWTWTGYAVLNKILSKKVTILQINLFLYGIPMLMFLPFADFKTLFAPHTLGVWLLLIFVALNTIISYGSLSMAMKYTEANKTGMIIILNPVITLIILEVMLWLEVNWFESHPMKLIAYIGAALILTGAFLATGAKAGKRITNSNPPNKL